MEVYRKSDQYYDDEYDRRTINDLKEKEGAMLEAEKLFMEAEEDGDGKLLSAYFSLSRSFTNAGVRWAREKEMEVKDRMMADERKDRTVGRARVPEGVRCGSCGAVMESGLTDFVGRGMNWCSFSAALWGMGQGMRSMRTAGSTGCLKSGAATAMESLGRSGRKKGHVCLYRYL